MWHTFYNIDPTQLSLASCFFSAGQLTSEVNSLAKFRNRYILLTSNLEK